MKSSVALPNAPQLLTPMTKRVEAQTKQRQEEAQEMKSLSESPLWHRVRKQFEEQIKGLENIQSVQGKDADEKILNLESNKKAASILRGFIGEIDGYAEKRE